MQSSATVSRPSNKEADSEKKKKSTPVEGVEYGLDYSEGEEEKSKVKNKDDSVQIIG